MTDKKRLFFIDNSRIFLILLVIAHHVGQAYGPTGGWWAYQNPERVRILGFFFTVNRSFFMSLFFMISGYFMPSSFDRKGAKGFLKDRCWRFGIPLLFFFFILIPIQHYAYFLHFRHYGHIPFWAYYVGYYLGLGVRPADWSGPSWPEFNFGHLWFIEHLLVFAICYALLRTFWKKPAKTRAESNPPGNKEIFLLTLTIAVMSFIIRLWYPIDKWIGFLGIIQTAFADVPRDLSWFIVGVIAYRRNWFFSIPKRTGLVWLSIGIAMAALCYVLGPLHLFPWSGGGVSLEAFIYPVWEALLCSGLCIGLLVFFRENLNHQDRLAKTLAENTYGVYLFHVPLVVSLQYAISGLVLGPFLKFLLVFILAVPITFTLCNGLRKLPVMRTIL